MADKNFPKTTVVITVDIQPVDHCSHRLHYLRDAVHRLLEDHLKYMSEIYEDDCTHFTTPDADVRMKVMQADVERPAPFESKSSLLLKIAIDRGIPVQVIKMAEADPKDFAIEWPMDLASNTADPEFVKRILEGYEEEGGGEKK